MTPRVYGPKESTTDPRVKQLKQALSDLQYQSISIQRSSMSSKAKADAVELVDAHIARLDQDLKELEQPTL